MPHRIERLNQLIRKELSELLRMQVKDPRLDRFVAITGVSVTADLKHARVFVSNISSAEERKNILDALGAASGFLRRELNKNIRMRYTPELSFHWDDSIERGDHILHLLDQVSEETGSQDNHP
jgi:ribosome-binding factor A